MSQNVVRSHFSPSLKVIFGCFFDITFFILQREVSTASIIRAAKCLLGYFQHTLT